MKPVHTTKLCELYQQDALEFLKPLVDLDMIILDPPFNIGQDYGDVSDEMPEQKFYDWIEQLTDLSMLALRPGGILVCHGPDTLAERWCLQRSQEGWTRLSWNLWHYSFAQNQTGNWPDTKAHSMIFRNGDVKHTWNTEGNLVETERRKKGDKRVADKNGWKVAGSVWGVPSDGPNWGRVQGNNAERCAGRPNQLPEVYYARLIRAYTNPGDRIGDPCAGTGTCLVVGEALGRRVIGNDLSDGAIETIKKRLERGAVRV